MYTIDYTPYKLRNWIKNLNFAYLISFILLSLIVLLLIIQPDLGQSVLLNIQERLLHNHNINTFIDKLPALQTMQLDSRFLLTV